MAVETVMAREAIAVMVMAVEVVRVTKKWDKTVMTETSHPRTRSLL